MKRFLKAVALAQSIQGNLYYNHSYDVWNATTRNITSVGLEFIYSFKK